MVEGLSMPAYLEYGARDAGPGPLRCSGGRLRGLVLEGDGQALDDLCRRALTELARRDLPGGPLEYRPLGHHVLLLIGTIARIVSTLPSFRRRGWISEQQAALLVPLVAGREQADGFGGERLLLAAPYVLVDNPISLLAGREMYGYAKSLARFAQGRDGELVVSTFGGRFGPDEHADWCPLIEIEHADGSGDDEDLGEPEWTGPADFVEYLLSGAPRAENGDVMIDDIRLKREAIEEGFQGRSHQLLVKHFRDATDGMRASQQELVQVPVLATRLWGWPSPRKWQVTIHPLDSHPIGPDLGASTQTTRFTFTLDMDFTLEAGERA